MYIQAVRSVITVFIVYTVNKGVDRASGHKSNVEPKFYINITHVPHREREVNFKVRESDFRSPR